MEVSRIACGPKGLRSATSHLLALCILIAVNPGVGVATMSTSSSFSVTPHGAASYTVPIRVAPGIAGVEPKLALSYTSGSGNGPFGAGWTLSGTSAVTRCPRNFAIDGVRGATVNFDANDRFCLDGQRLVPADGNNSPYFSPGREYRTEIESFSRVIANGSAGLSGPASFTVFTKSGDIIHYGHTPDSQIDGAGAFTPMVWAMNRVQDRRGNFMTFSYLETPGVLEFYLQRADYTGNASLGQAPTQSVLFEFDTSRSDKATGFGPRGIQLRGDRRVTNIRVLANGNLVRRYTPTYGQSGVIPAGRMRMLSLQECSPATLGSATEHCLPPHSFSWPDGSATPCRFNPTTGACDANAAGSSVGGWHRDIRDLIMDVNGDGRSDMVRIWLNGANFHAHVALSEGSRFGVNPVSNDSIGRQFHVGEVASGDVNGDGLADLVNGDGTWISDGTRFTRTGNGLVLGDKSILTDLNGDGRADALIMAAQDVWWGDNPTVTRVVQWAYSTGTGFTGMGSLELFNSAWRNGRTPGKHYFKDVNGDGRTDVVYFEWNCTFFGGDAGTCTAGEFLARVFLSNGTGFTELPTTSVGYIDASLSAGFSEVVTDVNGDGKSDLVLMQYEGTQTVIRTLLSNGSTFVTGTESRFVGTHGADRFDVPFDGNADGRGDIARIFNRGGTASVEIYYSNGTGYTKAPFFDVGGWSNTDIRNYVADVNGDGRVDIVRLQNVGGTAHAHIWGHTGHLPDLVSTFDNGLGSNILVSYQTLAMPGVYTRGAAASYPLMIVQGPMPVVRQIDMDAGNGGRTRVDYSYERFVVDHDGRGSLGFARVSQLADAPVGRIWSRTNYSQTYPFIGMTTSSERQINSGPLIGRSTNTLDQRVIDGRRPFPYVRQVFEQGWDLGGLALPSTTTTTTYDEWGNATSIAVSTSDGFSRTTTNEYRPADVGNWILGRLNRATVSATSPPNPIETPSLPSFTVGVGSGTLSNVSNTLGLLSVATSVVPSGGVAPITYSWSRISGSGINANQPAGSNLAEFSRNFTVRESVTNIFRVTARDAAGRATTRDVTVTLRVNALPSIAITSPATNTIVGAPATFALSVAASDTDGSIAKVDYFNGATLIATITTAPYNFNWTNVPGGTYSVTARATDNDGAVTTSAAVSLVSNVLPTVALTSPANGESYSAPATIPLRATATDAEGIAWVEFLHGTTVLHRDTTAPYEFNWAGVGQGNYLLSARAQDLRGGVASTATVSVGVNNALPVVSVTSPANGAVVNSPGTFTLSATATDPDGSITKVEFLNGTSVLATLTSAPYTFTWSGVPPGTYALAVRATDNANATITTPPLSVRVNTPPSISFSPSGSRVIPAPGNFSMSAIAADTDGSVVRVEFMSGNTVISTVTTPPYNFTWSNLPAGNYWISARAIDNDGGVAASPATHLMVNAPPVVTLYDPQNNAVFVNPRITLSSTVTNPDGIGVVSSVNYRVNGNGVASATGPGFITHWNAPGEGTYVVTAHAQDDHGMPGESAPATIRVVNPVVVSASPPAPTVAVTSSGPMSTPVKITATGGGGGYTFLRWEKPLGGSRITAMGTFDALFYVVLGPFPDSVTERFRAVVRSSAGLDGFVDIDVRFSTIYDPCSDPNAFCW